MLPTLTTTFLATAVVTAASLWTPHQTSQDTASDPTADEARKADEPEADAKLVLATTYAEAMFDRREREAWSQLIPDDFAFVDPTADIWRAPYAKPIRGKDVFLRLEESWAIEWSTFARDVVFRAGDQVVLAGTIRWKAQNQPEAGPIGFATILDLGDETVVGRRDYGDYDALTANAAEVNADRLAFADAYVASYLARDLAALEGKVAHEVEFHAASAPEPVTGRFELLAHLEQAERPPTARFQPTVRFVSTSHVFLAGHLDRTEEERADLPFALALRLEDGRVREHREWVGIEADPRGD